MDERYYWLGFSLFPGIGPKKFHLLLTVFDSAKKAWEGEEKQLQKVIGPLTTQKFLSFRQTFSFDLYLTSLQKKNITFVTLSDVSYPQKLAAIGNPPFVLYIKGNGQILSQKNTLAIGIVGTRKITQYGKDVTTFITKELVDSGCVIVSGLAMGVDATAHRVTLENNGQTIAVLGCGVDCCSPRENLALYNRILENGGAIVSEIPPGMGPTPGSFPARNRIIAGLSDGVVVTEGTEDSGALYTAEDAFKEGRKVFAVPGPITSQFSKAPVSLLRKGASVVTNANDILSAFQIKTLPRHMKEKLRGDTDDEQKILDLLEQEPLHIDEISKLIQKDAAAISVLLSMLELKGFIKQTDNLYSLVV